MKIRRSSINSFLIGIGSVINIFPTPKEVAYDKVDPSDTKVLKSDWKAIGGDFEVALKKNRK